MLIAQCSVERILRRGSWLVSKFVELTPARATQQKADPDTDDEEELADGLGEWQVSLEKPDVVSRL